MRIGIVGGGLSGLATAFYLQHARPDFELVIYEAAHRVGGALRTDEVQGFRFEAGCNGFLSNKPDALALVEASRAESLLQRSSDDARKRYIYTDALHRMPESPDLFLKTPLVSAQAKLRLLGELFVPARRDGADESLREFGYRRVGREFTDVFLDAMTAGIYGSTPDRLSVAAAFPLVADLEREHGGLFRGMLAKRKKQAGPGGVLTSFHGGVSTFVEHLRRTIRADWRLNLPVAGVEVRDGAFRIHARDGATEVDRVVVATPAYAAAGLLRDVDRELATRLARIEYSPIAVVGFGYRHLDRPLDGFGLLTTASARQPVLGILWDTSIFPDRAPPGAKILRAMIGGQRNPEFLERDRAGLVELALAGIRNTMGIDATPDVEYVCRWERGIPNYGVGHLANVAAIDAAVARVPGLHLASNAYHGVAMNDCCRNGRQLALSIVERFEAGGEARAA